MAECEFCKKGGNIIAKEQGGHKLTIEICPSCRDIGITSGRWHDGGWHWLGINLEMSYCPKCGRELKWEG